MKKLLKNNVFKRFFRPRYRVPNGIRKNKYQTAPPTIEQLEFVHKIISQKREDRNKLSEKEK